MAFFEQIWLLLMIPVNIVLSLLSGLLSLIGLG